MSAEQHAWQTQSPALPPRDWFDLFRRFFHIAGGFWKETNWSARTLLAVLVVLTAAQVAVQVALNIWTEQLFDAFGTKSMGDFLLLAGAFGLIIVTSLAVTTSHLRVRRTIQIAWRQWLTSRLAGEWMASGRHYRMAYMAGDHDNPDGRISEDIRIATEAAVDLGHSLVYCVMLLATFIHILWSLSGIVRLGFSGFEIELSGHLVWAAVAYAAVGVSIALLLGPPLVSTAEARQTYEANFRFGLVHARENSTAIALVHGEAGERRRFRTLLKEVVDAWSRQTAALFKFFIFSSIWSVLSPVFPILIAAPRYIAGTISLGVLMQIAQAFQQTIGALSWPIDNLSRAAEWRASVERILGLRAGIEGAQRMDWCTDCARIDSGGSPAPELRLDSVTITDPAGATAVEDLTVEVGPGEQVWLCGERPAASAVVKALAGLWTSGHGRILLPSDGRLFFMPQRPYLPLAPLREVVTYPALVGDNHDEVIGTCLRRVGLAHIADNLQATEIWDESLSFEEQQRLGFARLLFHRPRWIVLEEPADALSADDEREMMALLRAALPDAALIVAGDRAPAGIEWKKIMLAPAEQARAAATN